MSTPHRNPEASHAQPEDLVELGRIVSAYGVKGWVKIQPHSSGGNTLLDVNDWWLRAPVPPGGTGVLPPARPVSVVNSRPQGSTIVAQIESVTDRDIAHNLKNHTVWVPRGCFAAPEDDEYYWVDLIGCQLYGMRDDAPGLIGVVADVTDNGAHALLKVERQLINDAGEATTVLNARGRPVEILVPFVHAHVHAVDIVSKRIDSDWPVDL
ncbi:ribosome maturation factor RimM [Allopusillimonas ginsengisoli]|uniref:ribosome maturation factor RimM n=1 Tax=Allopusillimonas ginsengisoli TaxID=453575 RepID=UPI0010C2033D|nr:ribosome maturation factor RimM [Allopusillimonas ginsengisoli]